MENLDAMPATELWEVWRRIHKRPVVAARAMFPNRPTGYVRAAAALAGYASNKATAMSCRARGDTTAAQVYEHICDNIYDRLPPFARW